jgi:hypothetical protein
LVQKSDTIEGEGRTGMLASTAAITFLLRHQKDQDGEVELRITSEDGELDFVARVTWWPPVCMYRSAFADWPPSRAN